MSAGTLSANPRELPGALVAICGVLVLVGVAALAIGISSDPASAWRAFHVNFLYFGTFAQAALCLSCALIIIGARWAGPIRHVAEGLAAWVPVSFVLFIVGQLFGAEVIHRNWIHGAPPGKVSQPSLPGGAPCNQFVWMYSRPNHWPTMNSTSEIGTQAERPSATWRIGPAQRAPTMTRAHARQSAACDIVPK